ncbi:hypothetical protein [Streptomyces sp. NPDC051909]|uniref:hypothetical protein n=1 Tax=Streptomyces sp. NPDC051909 TaxID=3154944 RepID=UPI003423A50D
MTHSGQGPEQHYPAAQPLPPEVTPGGPSDAQATQYLPPVPPQQPPAYGYPQPQAPQPGYGYPGPDAQATQYLPPVPHQAPQAPQEAATQYMAPVPPAAPVPGERPPLADFDNLFRSETPNPAPAPAPGYGYPQQPPAPPQQPYGYQQQGPPQQYQQPQQPPQQYQQQAYQDAYYDDEPEPPRRKSPLALIAAVVVGCAVVGLGAGMLLSGGDDDKKDDATGKGGQNVAASSAAPSGRPSGEPAADPAKGQAEELDKLLADSNNSRDAVISAVASIGKCQNLDQAASDLRGAAKQRRELVTRLQGLTVDKVPDHAALSAALVKAWKASAAADDYYAAWADQARTNKKVCKDDRARPTSQKNEGDKKSVEATAAKKQAAGLWNPTADKYGLTRRTYTQL